MPSGLYALTAMVQAPEAPHTPQGFSQVASRRGSLTNKIYIHSQYYSPKYAHFVTYGKKFLKQIVGKCKIVLDILIILKPVWKIYPPLQMPCCSSVPDTSKYQSQNGDFQGAKARQTVEDKDLSYHSPDKI